MKKILVVRADRLGDVILSTPVLEALKVKLPDAEISFLVQPPMKSILEGQGYRLLSFDPRVSFYEIVRSLKAENFDAAIVLQHNPKISMAVWMAGIPVRVGPLSKPTSWICFNRGVRQRRSRVEKHEAEYGLDLLRAFLASVGLTLESGEKYPPRVNAKSSTKSNPVTFWCCNVVVHPGMGGSAHNWPAFHYSELIVGLLRSGKKVGITGGSSDREFVGPIVESIKEKISVAEAENLVLFGGAFEGEKDLSLRELAEIFRGAQVVIAPSTGPLHLAAAVGARVIGLYPNTPVQSAKRWGPYLAEKSLTLSPPDGSDDMSKITVNQVQNKIMEFIL